MKFYNYILLLMLASLFSCSKSDLNNNNLTSTKTGSLASFITYRDYLYILDGYTLKAFDIQEKDNPILIQEKVIGNNLETIFTINDLLLIGSTDAVYILSVDANGIATVTGKAEHITTCDPVVSDGKYAYSTTRAGTECGGSISELSIYDISNIYNPSIVSRYEMSQPLGLAIHNDVLYVCDMNYGLTVFDVTDRTNPEKIKIYPDVAARDIIILDNESMIVMVNNGMWFFDIREPLNPRLKYKYE